jgi:hypothetical protein
MTASATSQGTVLPSQYLAPKPLRFNTSSEFVTCWLLLLPSIFSPCYLLFYHPKPTCLRFLSHFFPNYSAPLLDRRHFARAVTASLPTCFCFHLSFNSHLESPLSLKHHGLPFHPHILWYVTYRQPVFSEFSL